MTISTLASGTPSRIFIPGTYNLRAVDSVATESSVIADGRLYRSDALHAIDDQGHQQLKDLGIYRILDLRSDDEVTKRPDQIPADTEYIRVPMTLVDGHRDHDIALDLTVLYARLVQDHGASLTRAVTQLAGTENRAVLVHCTAGKDRTGLVVALALLAVGVKEVAVVADYARTESHLIGEWTEGMLSELHHHGFPVTEQTIKILNGSPAETMVATVALINSEFGGAKNYLAAHGMTGPQFQALEDFLLDVKKPISLKKEQDDE